MEKNEVPPNWAHLVNNLTEKATKEHYELAKTWLFPDPELGNISRPEQNPANHNKSDKTLSEWETFTHNNVSSSMLPTGTQSPSCVNFSISTVPGISQQEYFPDPLLHSVLPFCCSSIFWWAWGNHQELLLWMKQIKTDQQLCLIPILLHNLNHGGSWDQSQNLLSLSLYLSWCWMELKNLDTSFRQWASFLCCPNCRWFWINQWPLWWHN